MELYGFRAFGCLYHIKTLRRDSYLKFFICPCNKTDKMVHYKIVKRKSDIKMMYFWNLGQGTYM